MRSIYIWAWLAGLQILVPWNPPPQAFTIFDSDGNGEIDIGKLSLKREKYTYVWDYPALYKQITVASPIHNMRP